MLHQLFKKIYAKEIAEIKVNESLKRELGACFAPPVFSLQPLWNMLTIGGAVAVLGVLFITKTDLQPALMSFGPKVDDWQHASEIPQKNLANVGYSGDSFASTAGLSSGGGGLLSFAENLLDRAAPRIESETLGFAVGGAKDINNFRLDIENGYLPLPTDITSEGLFYDYFFETGNQKPCDELFCPSYATAVSTDPISGKEEYYLSVGLNSGMTEEDFERKPLNLVIVLDISGSMSSSFDEYYYDGSENTVSSAQKIDVAKKAILALFDHLRPDDRLGFVVFDDTAEVAKPLRFIEETNMEAIASHVEELEPDGGTNMSSGMKEGMGLFKEIGEWGELPKDYENRIIFLTDAMPNHGDISSAGLFGMIEEHARKNIYTTMIGIGVDFQTELVEQLTKTRGANYFAVHSSEEFVQQLDEEFELMVTPLVFDLELTLNAEGWKIEQVYGSPEADQSTGELMFVSTLFPSKTQDHETRGGVVLLKLTPTGTNKDIELVARYKDRDGRSFESSARVQWPTTNTEHFDNSGIQKAVLLARYADLLKNWINHERGESRQSSWEQRSMPLRVSTPYQEWFALFAAEFQKTIDAVNDSSLKQELDILKRLSEDF